MKKDIQVIATCKIIMFKIKLISESRSFSTVNIAQVKRLPNVRSLTRPTFKSSGSAIRYLYLHANWLLGRGYNGLQESVK